MALSSKNRTTMVRLIMNSASEDDIRVLGDALRSAIRLQQQSRALEARAQIIPGTTKVALRNIKPKYMNGLVGTITSVEGNKVHVLLDSAPPVVPGRKRWSQQLTVPLSCLVILDDDQ